MEAAEYRAGKVSKRSEKRTDMKTRYALVLIVVALLLNAASFAQQVSPPQSAADIAGTPAGTVMTREYVQTVGRLLALYPRVLAQAGNPRWHMEAAGGDES
jgi:hypothetical protein